MFPTLSHEPQVGLPLHYACSEETGEIKCEITGRLAVSGLGPGSRNQCELLRMANPGTGHMLLGQGYVAEVR